MNTIGIEAVVGYIPDLVSTREDRAYLNAVIPPGMEEIFRGPDELRQMRGETAVENAGELVARKALNRAELQPTDIDFIIATNSVAKYALFYPSFGSWIHYRLGFSAETPVLNTQNQCASFVDGLAAAWHMIQAGNYQRILVVASMSYERMADPTDVMSRFVADGACAAIVSSQHLKGEFLAFDSMTYGILHEHLTMKLRPLACPDILPNRDAYPAMGNYGFSDPWLFQWTMTEGKGFAAEGIERALAKAKLTAADVDIVLYHQVGALAESWIEGAAERGLSRDKWKNTYNKYGTNGNSDIGINLAEFSEAGQIEKDSVIVLHGSGGAGELPVLVLRWLV